MALLADVVSILSRLGPRGWNANVFSRLGLNTSAADMSVELSEDISQQINSQRNLIGGLRDFAQKGKQAIEPGLPGLSLLYHVLASPDVHPTPDGTPSSNQSDYPTLDELDVIENYIYSLNKNKFSDLSNLVVAVFAFQYRVGGRTAHQRHADFAFSRTGVSRIGTAEANYDARRRSYWPEPATGADGFAVMPARFGVFLCERRTPGVSDSIMNQLRRGPANYLFPVHKIFSGSECLSGFNLSVTFDEGHINEKLRRVHRHGGIPVLSGFNVDEKPFVKTEGMVSLDAVNGSSSVLLVPKHTSSLIQLAEQRNSVTGRNETVRFMVKPRRISNNRENRFFDSSYEISAQDGPPGSRHAARLAPEYLNIRHRVNDPTGGLNGLEDIGATILDEAEYLELLNDGGFEAAHFTDNSCDGFISATVSGIGKAVLSAYSIVSAPDFFPRADQHHFDKLMISINMTQTDTSPLSDEDELFSNLSIRTSSGDVVFENDKTMTAIVAHPQQISGDVLDIRDSEQMSYLPDAASNVFAPGWDISVGRRGNSSTSPLHLAAYGLGSPFPEDAKLCAALSSFWPAAAPDSSRTFFFRPNGARLGTRIPMLDVELGYHSSHPEVVAGSATSKHGWDGEFGPFVENVGGDLFVNAASARRSDYVRNALNGKMWLGPLVDASASELANRMSAFQRNLELLLDREGVAAGDLWLVSAKKILDWSDPQHARASAQMQGSGYLFVFAVVQSLSTDAGELGRLRWKLRNKQTPAGLVPRMYTCQVSASRIAWKIGSGIFAIANA